MLGLTRKHYDRLAHFAFGLLFACPTREVLLRMSNLRGVRLAFATVSMLLAASAGYERIEWWVALRAAWTRLRGRRKPGRFSRGGASPRRNP